MLILNHFLESIEEIVQGRQLLLSLLELGDFLTQLLIGPDSVLLSGSTDTFNTVDDIKSRLEGQAGFKGVTISSATMEKSDNRIRFKLKVQL